MTNKILCILPICCNPSNKDSCKGEKRIIQYVDGLKKFFEYSLNFYLRIFSDYLEGIA